jgi:ArsR family transcriptional regulator
MAKKKINEDVCGCNTIHEDVIAAVRKKMPDEERLFELADLYKAFGDSTRVRILSALSEAEMCVCDLCALLDMKQSAISHQLGKLRQARLVKKRKDGKVVYYSLDDNHVKTMFKQGLLHVSH